MNGQPEIVAYPVQEFQVARGILFHRPQLDHPLHPPFMKERDRDDISWPHITRGKADYPVARTNIPELHLFPFQRHLTDDTFPRPDRLPAAAAGPKGVRPL